MELMSTSFDKFYKYVYSVLDDVIPEEILGKITLAVSILFNLLFVYVFEANVKNWDLSHSRVRKLVDLHVAELHHGFNDPWVYSDLTSVLTA